MIELMIHLDASSGVPLYGQIYEYIRLHIADGKISRGEKLPSTRLLASHLQISRSTVELAYEQLLSEGYIESRPYRGYYVNDISGLYLSGKGRMLQSAATQEQPEHAAGTEAVPVRIDFSPNRNEMKFFPYSVWRRISKNVLAEDDPELFLSGEAAGEMELRKAICGYLYHARGVNCTPDQLIVGAGNEYLLILLSQVLGTDRTVVMENPTYLQAYHTLTHMHYHVTGVSRDAEGICMEDIRHTDPDIVYTMPSHQFPMGTVMPMKRRLELLQWAAEKENRYIIEDDHDSEFRYKGKPIPSLQGNDTMQTVIYIGTFSKSIGSAIRVSYMVLPEKLLADYHANCGFYSSTVPKEQQRMLTAFLEQGSFERHLNRMRGIYKNRHDLFLRMLRNENWVHRIYGDHAGMHLLVEAESALSAEELVHYVREQGIRIYALEEFMIPGESSPAMEYPTLVLGYGALEEEDMLQGIRCIRDVIRTQGQKEEPEEMSGSDGEQKRSVRCRKL